MEAVVEEAVMEAVVERDPRKPGREACMDKRRARETAAAETHAAAHASDMHSATPAAGMHAATHPAAVHAAAHTATVHATAHAATVAAAATTAATPSECRWHKRKRRRERTRNEASKDPAGHPNSSSVIEWPRQMPPHEDNDREMIQRFQLTNATVSDAEVRFAQKVFRPLPHRAWKAAQRREFIRRQRILGFALDQLQKSSSSGTIDPDRHCGGLR
jgi:hypothetical protein